MSIVIKHELTSSVDHISGSNIKVLIPQSGSINLFYYNQDNSLKFIDSSSSVIALDSFNNIPFTASNTGNGIGFYSGSNTTIGFDSNEYTTETVEFKFYSISGSDGFTVNKNENTLEISNSLSNSFMTNTQYSASNIGVGQTIFSGSVIAPSKTTFVFNTITGANNNSIVVTNSNNVVNITSNITVSLDTTSNITYGMTTQSFFQPDPILFTSATFVLPDYISANSMVWPISGVFYIFGSFNPVTGLGTGKIFHATMSNPTSWSQAASAVSFFGLTQQAIIGNKIYHFSEYQNSPLAANTTIYSASVTNPLIWSSTGASLPSARLGAGFYVSKETGKIILYGGRNSSDVPQSTIFTASISNPLVWGTATQTLPIANAVLGLVEIGDWIYLYGGEGSNKAIWRAHKTNPLVVTDTGFSLTRSLTHPSAPVQIGNYIYILSNLQSNGTFRIDINNPLVPQFISGAMAVPVATAYHAAVFTSQGKVFHIGGGGTAGTARMVHTSSYVISCSTMNTTSSLYQNATAIFNTNRVTTQYSTIEKFGSYTIWKSDIDR